MTDTADDARDGPGTANEVPDRSPVRGEDMITCWHGGAELGGELQGVGSAAVAMLLCDVCCCIAWFSLLIAARIFFLYRNSVGLLSFLSRVLFGSQAFQSCKSSFPDETLQQEHGISLQQHLFTAAAAGAAASACGSARRCSSQPDLSHRTAPASHCCTSIGRSTAAAAALLLCSTAAAQQQCSKPRKTRLKNNLFFVINITPQGSRPPGLSKFVFWDAPKVYIRVLSSSSWYNSSLIWYVLMCTMQAIRDHSRGGVALWYWQHGRARSWTDRPHAVRT